MQPEVIKKLDHLIKINQRVAQSVGQLYVNYLNQIFSQVIEVYKMFSQCISNSINYGGNENMVKPMKALRRDILKLIQTYIENEVQFDLFRQRFLPSLQELMSDYSKSEPMARDPETLLLFATILKQDGQNLAQFLNSILGNLCTSTLGMISNDFISFPEFREPFFTLVHNIITKCTMGLLQLQQNDFTTIIETVIFGVKHEKPEVMETSL